MPLHTDAAGLKGTDFLERTGAMISFECGKMFTDIGKVPHVYSVSPARHAALTVFTRCKDGHSIQPKQEARQMDGQIPAGPPSQDNHSAESDLPR